MKGSIAKAYVYVYSTIIINDKSFPPLLSIKVFCQRQMESVFCLLYVIQFQGN